MTIIDAPRATGPASFRDLIEAEVARFGVPGAAVTAVAAGEVVLAEGFGHRDGDEPVTARTTYMLASDTKCFAAATLCLLVEDGRLDLDRPVQDYLPWFAMHDETLSGRVTCRDLLAHRTGLPRHSALTIGDHDFRITNEQVARSMRHLEASRPFRQGFSYNNAHYATAGHVAEVVSGQSWPDLLAERVLSPLGMGATTTYTPPPAGADVAAPHLAGRRLPLQARPYDLPSGGLVTNAEDLGRWLLARLGHGTLSPAVLRLLHTPCVIADEAAPGPELHPMGYALGNLAFSYRGHRLQLHGGSQIGYSSQVVVLPDAQVGVAVLTNAHGSTLPLALTLSIVDRLLGLPPLPWGERLSAAAPARSVPTPRGGPPPARLEDLAGTFTHPAYGDLVLQVRDGALMPTFHGLDELSLVHLGGADWLLCLATLPGFEVPLTFVPGGVTLVLEPELAPLAFPRR